MVIVTSGMSIRLLSKAALFHQLERGHLAVVAQASNALTMVHEGGKSAGNAPKRKLVDNVRKGKQLAMRAISELFPIERAAFDLIGFG